MRHGISVAVSEPCQEHETSLQEDVENFVKAKQQNRSFDSVPLKYKLSAKEVALFAVNKYRFNGVNIKARLMRNYPLGKTMAHVLGYVGRINQQEITFHIFRDKTAITRWIDQLEKNNLVLRVPDKLDRRKNLIYLTNVAKELFPKVLEIAKEAEMEAVKGISGKDVETCKEVLRKVRANLEEII